MKTKHLSEAAKFLIIAATILIVCALVVVAFIVMKEGKSGANKSISQYNAITNQVSNIDREKYDGLLISGDELRDLIEDVILKEDIIVEYKTLAIPETTIVAEAGTLELKKDVAAEKDKYINPTGLFIGKSLVDENGVLKLLFTQTKTGNYKKTT